MKPAMQNGTFPMGMPQLHSADSHWDFWNQEPGKITYDLEQQIWESTPKRRAALDEDMRQRWGTYVNTYFDGAFTEEKREQMGLQIYTENRLAGYTGDMSKLETYLKSRGLI